MTDTPRLTLAFVGTQEVHRNNARSLLEDFVDGWLKQHRKGEVVVLLPEEVDTDTIKDLEDWAGTAGHVVSYTLLENLIKELLEEPDARLILVGDPNEDGILYDVTEEAARYRIQVRSLINGLEKVVFDDEDFEDDLAGQDGFHEVDVESGEGWAEDADDELSAEAKALLDAVDDVEEAPADDATPDLDMLATLADDGEVEAQQEIKNIAEAAGIDTAPFDTWQDAVEAIRGKQDADFYQDPDNVVAGDRVELTKDDRNDLVEEVASREEVEEAADLNKAVYTRAELEAMDFDKVKAIALEHGIPPGRGMKHKVFVNKILQVTGVETEAPKQKRTRKQKAEPVEATITPIRQEPDDDYLDLKSIAASLRSFADQLDPPSA